MRTQPRLLFAWLIWGINLVGNGLVFYYLMPRSLQDIYPQYVFQSAYLAVQAFLEPSQVAGIYLVMDYLLWGAFVGLGLLLVWRKPSDILALIISSLFIVGGIQISSVTYMESRYLDMPGFAWLEPLQNLMNLLSLYGLGVFVFIFPDGRFVPRFLGRWVAVYLAVSLLSIILLQRFLGDDVYGYMIITLLILFFGGLASQVYRYRFQSTSLQRQQAKFVLVGFSAFPMLGLVSLVLFSPNLPFAYEPVFNLMIQTLGFLALLLIPLTLTASILRYRLWDIDVIIRRTLQYTLLTGLLVVVYFSVVVLLQSILTLALRDLGPAAGDYYSRLELQQGLQSPDEKLASAGNGQPPAVTIVLSTLAAAALFNPLRRRLQDFIDRRFYRQKYDAELALAEFATAARSEADLVQLSTRLASTVHETLQPDKVDLWLNKSATSRERPFS